MMKNTNTHIVPLKYYIATIVSLLFLTFLTVFIAQFDFGVFNLPIALSIACLKAAFVIGFFMGLHFDRGFISFFFLSSLLAIFLFFLFVFSDVIFRGSTEPLEASNFGFSDKIILNK